MQNKSVFVLKIEINLIFDYKNAPMKNKSIFVSKIEIYLVFVLKNVQIQNESVLVLKIEINLFFNLKNVPMQNKSVFVSKNENSFVLFSSANCNFCIFSNCRQENKKSRFFSKFVKFVIFKNLPFLSL